MVRVAPTPEMRRGRLMGINDDQRAVEYPTTAASALSLADDRTGLRVTAFAARSEPQILDGFHCPEINTYQHVPSSLLLARHVPARHLN